MDYLIVCLVALVASGLTLFSGFGLGALFLPAFALFFPVTTAVAMTAIVHLANNLFKLAIVGRHAHAGTMLQFVLATIPAATAGAWCLRRLDTIAPLFRWSFGGAEFSVTPTGLCIGILLIVFAAFESSPSFSSLGARTLPRWGLSLGGAVSGFSGGWRVNKARCAALSSFVPA